MKTTRTTILTLVLAALGVLAAPALAQTDPVRVEAHVSQPSVAPGGEFVVAVILDHDEGFHVWPSDPVLPEALKDFQAFPTEITSTTPGFVTTGRIQWPEEHAVEVAYTGAPVELIVYEGRAVAYVPMRLSADAPDGELTLTLAATFQACNEFMCFPPETKEAQVTIAVDPDAPVSERDPELFGAFDASVYADPDAWGESADGFAPATEPEHRRKFLGLFALPPIDSALGITVIALTSALGGLVLNLTPCVLPVIPIKVMTITQHAGEAKSKALALGLWMALGVVAFWFGIGLPVAFVGGFVDPSIIFGIWWITGAIGVVIAAMGLGIMGWFSINLPQKAYMINPKADSAQGSFMFGVMTGVLGLPCFGFVAGALLAGAATMAPWQVLVIFTSLGIGMALPYLVLTLKPKLVSRIPKTGPASELVKQVMGLLMLAAAAYFIGAAFVGLAAGEGWTMPWWVRSVHWWVIAIIGVAAGLWLMVRTIKISKHALNRLSMSVVGVLVALGGVGAAANQTSHLYHNFWEPYTPEAFEQALASGKIVVLDFTAEWCLNCKTLEATVLSQNPVKPQLLSPDVVPMAADLTSVSAPGWKKLNELGSQGIPLLAVFAPGRDSPVWQEGAYSGSQVVAAIEKARAAQAP